MKPPDLLPCPFCDTALETWKTPAGLVCDARHPDTGRCILDRRALHTHELDRWNRRAPGLTGSQRAGGREAEHAQDQAAGRGAGEEYAVEEEGQLTQAGKR